MTIGSGFRRQKCLPASLDTWTDSSGKQQNSLHPNNFNQEDGLLLSRTWQPAIQQLRRSRVTTTPNWSSTTLPFLTLPLLTLSFLTTPFALPLRHSGFARVPVHNHAFKSYDFATLGSNPRKLSNQSMPSHICVFNKETPPASPSAVLNCDIIQLA
jgi:hypothetical protein